MQPSIKEFIESLKEKKNSLNKKDKENMHFQSVENFLTYYDQLPNEKLKLKAEGILLDYFDLLNEKNWILTSEEGKRIYFSHIMKVGSDYNHYLGFKTLMSLRGAFFGGLFVDLILLITGMLKHLYYIPLVTLMLVGYNRYLMLNFKKKHKLYGPHY